MTKYEKSIIYKLCCKDLTIQDIYIGSTVNFRNRKYDHKKVCNNSKFPNYKHYKYEFIRNNGGWDNWDMIQIKEVSCNNKRELEAEERKVFEELKPTLNKNNPFTTLNEKRLQSKKNYYDNHEERKLHKITKKICECGSSVSNSHYSRHITSKKHKNYLDTL